MSKKFSTLMASFLLASAFTTASAINAGVAKTGNNAVKKGDFVRLALDGTPTNTLTVGVANALTSSAVSDATVDDIYRQLWQVASIQYDSNTGVPSYQFINKKSGQYLAVKLETNNKGESAGAAKIYAGGNKSWMFDANGALYAIKGDSVYYFNGNLELQAKKGGVDAIGTAQKLYVERNITAIDLTADKLNDLMGANGKLYFNDEDVTEGESNIITDNKWKAYAEGSTPVSQFFLARMTAGKDSVTKDSKNPYLLMVDTAFYKGSTTLHQLMIDTLSISAAEAAKLKDPSNMYNATASAANYNKEKPAKFAHQVKTAMFSGKYTLYNDSISLTVVSRPVAWTQKSNITDGTYLYGTGVATQTTQMDAAGFTNAYNPNVPTVNPSDAKVLLLKTAVSAWVSGAASNAPSTSPKTLKLEDARFNISGELVSAGTSGCKSFADLYEEANAVANLGSTDKAWMAVFNGLKLERTYSDNTAKYYHTDGAEHVAIDGATVTANPGVVSLGQLSKTKVLTVGETIKPLIQPYATTGGDAVIDGNGKVYFLQVAKELAAGSQLRAVATKGQYAVWDVLANNYALADEVDATNVYAQWGFLSGIAGSYQVVNRGSGAILYAGPIDKATNASGTAIADTYIIDGDTLKLQVVDLSAADIREEKGVKYDYSGYYYAGPTDGIYQNFQITPASALLSNVAVQLNKDSVLILGKAEEAPVWSLEAGDAEVYGAEIPGLPQLKKVKGYKLYTTDAKGNKYYVYPNNDTQKAYAITKADSEHAASAAKFEFLASAANAYLFYDNHNDYKATINLNLTVPTIEASDPTDERSDYFSFAKSEYSNYRTLEAEDGLLGNAKIFMENEPNRFLYENTKNVVANNGNKVAKDSLNFLGIYNAAASVHNAALYIDTAYVDRKDNTRPQYMLALGVTEVAATEGHACTEAGKHFDADGKETTADKCVHATPGTEAYKTGRYLVSLKDSVPAVGFAKHPAVYDGNIRLAFVEAKHIKDTLEIANSKFTVEDHSADSITLGSDLNVATFALKIVDQATKSFVLETKDAYVRILNGVPVLTENIEDAAIFNIEATTEEATANEAIAAEGVQVIGGQGVVTVQGAAGKVITVANILGQTIANQVAASDNVTIAAPAGIVVVAVEGEATKVVVK